MQKRPGTMDVKLWKNSSLRLILPKTSNLIKSSEQRRSREGQQPDESSETSPPLPERLDKLIDQPWTKDASRSVDWWLWYIQQEFEMRGGTV